MPTVSDTSPAQPVGTMGLRGIWAQIANITAIGLICVVFYQDRHAALEAAKEDRQLFRESVQELRRDSDRQWRAIQHLTQTVQGLDGKLKGKSDGHSDP